MHNKLYYLVDWLVHTPNDWTWASTENVLDAQTLVKEFHHGYPDKASPNFMLCSLKQGDSIMSIQNDITF